MFASKLYQCYLVNRDSLGPMASFKGFLARFFSANALELLEGDSKLDTL